MAKSGSRSSSASSSSVGDQEQRYKRLKLESSCDIDETSVNEALVVAPAVGNMKTQAAFVNKLYKMLEDPDTSDLIAWSSHGDLFSVSNPTAFSKSVLPQYFKHNNWQSFVRQLNMYGFHKVNDLIHSNLTNENQTWEFKHPNFRRGAVGDLQHIKRKSAKTQQLQLQQQLQQQQQQQEQQQRDLQVQHREQEQREQQQQQREEQQQYYVNNTVIKHILRIEDHLLGVTKSCEQLFNEVVHLRMVVSKQQDAMQDLVDVVSSSARSNNNCGCSTNNNNNQELQNAENLRIQVSKLKEDQNLGQSYNNNIQNNSNRNSYMNHNHNGSNSGNESSNASWSPVAPSSSSANHKADESPNARTSPSNLSNPTSYSQHNNNNDTKQRKLLSFDSMQQQQQQSSYRLNNHSTYNSNRSSSSAMNASSDNSNYYNSSSNTNDDSLSNFDRKSSTASSVSSSASHQKYNADSEENKARSSKMSFGKQSHMLNPIGDGRHRNNKAYNKNNSNNNSNNSNNSNSNNNNDDYN
ncbi:Flocculation suppression protein [Mucor circinelloides]